MPGGEKRSKRKAHYLREARDRKRQNAWKKGKVDITSMKGSRGFMVTCLVSRETPVRGRMLEWINEHVESILDIEDGDALEGGDVSKSLEDEIAAVKKEERILETVDTGSWGGLLLFKLKKSLEIDPVEVARRIIRDAKLNGSRCPSAIKVFPVQACAGASNIPDILESAKPVISKVFNKDMEKSTFAIRIKRRACSALDRDALIKALAGYIAECAPKGMISVDLKEPEIVIAVEAFKSLALLSVIANYSSINNLSIVSDEKDDETP